MPPETWVLAFDTSAAHCAAALLSADRVVVLRHEEMAKGQAERLMPMLQEMLAEAGIGWRDLGCL
ncbi:MAG: tRNA (adenosine(37)-N6)-threonylcarbamoyltransferase complex dimerization subunit type 1 TsaB, partial [Paracoccaceae bacterium]